MVTHSASFHHSKQSNSIFFWWTHHTVLRTTRLAFVDEQSITMITTTHRRWQENFFKRLYRKVFGSQSPERTYSCWEISISSPSSNRSASRWDGFLSELQSHGAKATRDWLHGGPLDPAAQGSGFSTPPKDRRDFSNRLPTSGTINVSPGTNENIGPENPST